MSAGSALSPTELDALLAHSAWIRRLAGTLVRDDARADDLVQQAWLVALRRPPQPGLPPRPWLAQVLRNLLRMDSRGERRRRTREQATHGDPLAPEATAHAATSPEVLVARAQTQRTLTGLLVELDEPYRSTILLRYFEGLSAADIAERHGVPAGTVRWRLKTGLDRLRARLDREHHGDRRAWQLALAQLNPPGPHGALPPDGSATRGEPLDAPATPTALKGAMTMKTLLTVAVLASGVTGGALLASRTSASPTQTARPPAAPITAPAARPQAPSAPPRADVPVRPVRLDQKQRTDLLQRLEQAHRPPTGGAPPSTARLDPAYIRAQVQALIPLLKECYETALRTQPTLAGKLVVDFTIVGEPELGALVTDSRINAADSTIADADMRECVQETMYSAKFPAPLDGGEVRVNYPFVFNTGE